MFKLHLGKLPDNLRPELPIHYKEAIADYLREIRKLIEEMISIHWPGIDFLKQVLVVITVPAEYSEKDKAIMRECANKAELISEREKLQFTTERK